MFNSRPLLSTLQRRASPGASPGSSDVTAKAIFNNICRSLSAATVYKFDCSQETLDTVQATLPAVAEAGTGFTKHFYNRMFAANPELLNVFNQTNQALGGQPKKLLKTVAIAAQSAIETGELPGEAIEGICQKHAALGIQPAAYDIVGTNILGSIRELLTEDEKVLNAWGNLYGQIAKVFITREAELYKAMETKLGGWLGKREFKLSDRTDVSDTIARIKFEPSDGKPVPAFKPGQFLTVWVDVSGAPHEGAYTTQPRHYTLYIDPKEVNKSFSVNVKKQGLVSNILHEADIGTSFELSPPYGCFDLRSVERLWLDDSDAPVVLLSAGVGLTPVLAMLENIYVTRPASWLHAAENGSVHAYRERLREIAAVRDHHLLRRVWYSNPTAGDGAPEPQSNLSKYHYKGLMDLAEANKDFPPELLHLGNPNAHYFMCGPPGFMEDQKEALKGLGVDESRIHWEGF